MDPSEQTAAPTRLAEKDFYLAEFRGRALALALPGGAARDLSAIEPVLALLEKNRTRVLLLGHDRELLEKLVGGAGVVDAEDRRWLPRLWRCFEQRSRAALLAAPGELLPAACRRVALRLGLAKVVWIDPEAPLRQPGGERLSLLDVRGLDALLGAPGAGPEGEAAGEGAPALSAERRELLEEIRVMLAGGLPAVNLCSAEGLADDLFTYEGSGTFFTRERYLEVRRLALDEFDAAVHLVGRGVAEGYLVERSEADLEEILANAFGVFVEGRYLAGVGALLPHTECEAGEISSLYTLTRFLGEGVGGHLVGFAVDAAREAGFAYVFACTTADRVVRFFERQGFRRVSPSEVPPGKWSGYPEERRARVHCLRRDLA